MVSFWSKFKISYDERKELKSCVKELEKVLAQKMSRKDAKSYAIMDEAKAKAKVSLWAKFKGTYQELKVIISYVKDLEKTLDNKMSHKDVNAYARYAHAYVNSYDCGINLDEQFILIDQVEELLTLKMRSCEDEEEKNRICKFFYGNISRLKRHPIRTVSSRCV